MGSWVEKPRSLFWEWLLLSELSPLRSYFKKMRYSGEPPNPFAGFPDASVQFYNVGQMKYSGRIQFFPEPNNFIEKEEDGVVLGSTLAVVYFFGLSDLHFENLYCHSSSSIAESTLIFPIDIEIIFDQLRVLGDSYVLDAKKIKNDFGVSKILGSNLNPASVIYGFLHSFEILVQNKVDILDILSKLPIQKIPIRKLIRDTGDYYEALSGTYKGHLYPEEIEQLERGDIPYFYYYLNRETIFYISSNGEKSSNIKWNDVSAKESIHFKKTILPDISKHYVKNSVLQIARNFSRDQDNEFYFKHIFLNYKGDDIFLMIENEYKLRCKRLVKHVKN